MTRPILPGSTVGVLGGGQLGRMLGLAARRLGYRFHTLAPDRESPAAQIADTSIQAAYADVDRIREFARGVDVLTFEFENVPVAAAEAAADVTLVRPRPQALAVAQHRIEEKTFLLGLGLPVTPFAPVRTNDELAEAVRRIGRPAVLKTATFGYDGKGQVLVGKDDDPLDAWQQLGRRDAILEAFIELDREISVIGARGVDGSLAFFDPFENVHRHHILDVSVSPADIGADLARQALDITRAVLEALDYVGILCIEFFVTRGAPHLLVNEIAPRPHNSGHLTIDACGTSQFEQQLRAVCGLPLGSTDLRRPAAMANLLGDLWAGGEPDWPSALAVRDISLHLYGKATARAGRKMGHLTAMGPTLDAARARVIDAREALARLPR